MRSRVARSAAANAEDLRLIKGMVDLAVESGLGGKPGVIGHDEGQDGRLRAIEFPRIMGGKAFDTSTGWFGDMLADICQFLALSSQENALKYFAFWSTILGLRQAPAA